MKVTDGIQMEMTRVNILKTALGIQISPNTNNPITLVTRNASADEYTAPLKERLINYLIMNKIPKAINMSITEIFDLTPYEFKCIRESITKLGKQESNTVNNIVNELEMD